MKLEHMGTDRIDYQRLASFALSIAPRFDDGVCMWSVPVRFLDLPVNYLNLQLQ